MMKKLGLLLLSTVLASPNVQAEICRSKDANGVTQYTACTSSSKSNAQTVIKIATQPSNNAQSRADHLDKMQRLIEAFHDERLAREQAKADKKKVKAAKKQIEQSCKRQRMELDEILAGGIIFFEYDEEAGGRRYLSRAEVIERRDQRIKAIRANCGRKFLPEQFSKK